MIPVTLMFICILLLIVIIATPLKNAYVHSKGKHLNGVVVLPDIIHNHVKFRPIYGHMAEIVATCAVVAFICTVLYYRSWYTLFVFTTLLLIGYIIDMLYALLTVLPDSKNGNCGYHVSFFQQCWNKGSCNNLGVSGHFMIILLCLWFLSEFTHHKYWIVYLLVAMIGFFFICASRNHYTLDCVNSILVVGFLISLKERFFKQ